MNARHSYKVIHDYRARRDDELSINVGDIIDNVVTQSDGWASGRLVTGQKGLFPLNHAAPIEDATNLHEPTETYRALYSYKPTHDDEIELVAGTYIEVTSKDKSGWWLGKSMGREGIFPSNFVEGPLSPLSKGQDLMPRKPSHSDSPVILRRSSGGSKAKVKSFHASIEQSICAPALSATLFDPEDEPMGPMFGSLTSQFDWSTASLSSFKAKQGFFGRIRSSLSTKSLFPRFLSSRRSNNSLNDKSSIGSNSFRKRRNSFASFFQSTGQLPNNSPMDQRKYLPGFRQLCSTPKLDGITSNTRKLSSSSEFRSARNPEASSSWVFSGAGGVTSIKEHLSPIKDGSHEDSGYRDMDIDEKGEEIFGPIMEINDEVFEDMFDNKDQSDVSSSKANRSSRLSLSKIRTSLSPVDRKLSFGVAQSKRSSIRTNPNTNWKPKEEVKKKVEVTEL